MGITRILSSEPKPKVNIDHEKIQGLVEDVFREAGKLRFNVAVGHLSVLMTELPGMKSAIRVLRNTLVSCKEGLENQEVTKKAVLETIAEVRENFTEALKEILTELENQGKVQMEDLDLGTLRAYDNDMNRVQTLLTKNGTFAGYLPVIPISRPPLDVGKLKKLGFKAESFADYVILKEQLVFAVTNDVVLQHVTRVYKRDQVLEDYKESFLSRYPNMRLVPVGVPVSWWETTWFWMVPSGHLKSWNKATIMPTSVISVMIRRWSMPFIK